MPSVRGPRSEAPRSADAQTGAEPPGRAKEPSGLAKLIALLGSLQLALILLGGTSALLLSGTFLESWYGAAVAAQLIYQSWWFGFLLTLLAVNIACAALKKWPWKRHQTGFLITHIGLLTLLAGGGISASFGTSGVMLLVDDDRLASPGFGAKADDHLFDRRRDTLRVRRAGKSGDEFLEADFAPGWIPWSEAGLDSHLLNPFAKALAWIAQPVSPERRWGMDDLQIEVVAYAPQADWDPLRRASPATPAPSRFAAARFRIESPMVGKLPAQWIGDHEELRQLRLGPGLVQWLASDLNPQQLEEFSREPAAPEREAEGELVIGWGTRRWQWPVASLHSEKPIELADGWKLIRAKYQADAQRSTNGRPIDPALSIELKPPQGASYGLVTLARRAGALYPLPGYPSPDQLPPGFWVYYHPPDPAYGEASLRGLMRFALDRDGKLWMRSLHRGPAPGDAWIAEPSFALRVEDQPRDIWPAMRGKFQLEEYLPEAEALPECRPRERVGESEEVAAPPAVKCRLTRGALRQEVWLPRRPGVEVVVPLGPESIGLVYTQRREPLGFEVELKKSILRTESASGMPEYQASRLVVRDPDSGTLEGETTLNEPFEHRGYKLYQGMIQPAGKDERGVSLHRSLLQVGYDPGVWFKYGGSLLVCCGIACMFWTKAYFFGGWWDSESAAEETSAENSSEST